MAATFEVEALTPEWTSKTEIGKRTATCVYLAIASEPSTPAAAEAATGVPGVGTLYPGETTGSFKCVSREARGDPTRMIFRVTCEYDSTTTFNADPLTDPPTFDYSGEDSDEAYFKDTQTPAKYAQTTAYEVFPELPKRSASIVVIEYACNVAATANYGTYFQYANKLNNGGVTINGNSFTDGQVKVGCPKLSAVKNRNGKDYKVLSVTLKCREDGWDQKYESRGLYQLDSDGIFPVPIADDDGNPVSSPWPLDADGHAQDDATTPGADILLKPYKRIALSGLIA